MANVLLLTRYCKIYVLCNNWYLIAIIIQGHLVESVAWNGKNATEISSKDILIGTSNGM